MKAAKLSKASVARKATPKSKLSETAQPMVSSSRMQLDTPAPRMVKAMLKERAHQPKEREWDLHHFGNTIAVAHNRECDACIAYVGHLLNTFHHTLYSYVWSL